MEVRKGKNGEIMWFLIMIFAGLVFVIVGAILLQKGQSDEGLFVCWLIILVGLFFIIAGTSFVTSSVANTKLENCLLADGKVGIVYNEISERVLILKDNTLQNTFQILQDLEK